MVDVAGVNPTERTHRRPLPQARSDHIRTFQLEGEILLQIRCRSSAPSYDVKL
jgi:hypothetical protein